MTITKDALPIRYRPLAEDDLATAYTLSQRVKWPHSVEDWKLVQRLGEGIVAELDSKPIGTALCWNHGEKYASLGMVIVSPEHQGKGIGRQLMTQILVKIGNQKNVLLFATPSGQSLYESFGFQTSGHVYQHQAIIKNAIAVNACTHEKQRQITPDDHTEIAKLAETASGLERAKLLNEILTSASGLITEAQGEVTGFAVIRQFGRGYVIGPVVAPYLEQAKAMIQSLVNEHVDAFIRIDVPQNSELSPWLEEIGLPQVDTVTEMIRGNLPNRSTNPRLYAFTSQALG